MRMVVPVLERHHLDSGWMPALRLSSRPSRVWPPRPSATPARRRWPACGTDNLAGSQDVVIDLAGYFASSIAPCTASCGHFFGDNQFGQAGDGTTSSAPRKPAAVYGLSGITAIEGGWNDHTVTALADGKVWTWGTDIAALTPNVFSREIPDLTPNCFNWLADTPNTRNASVAGPNSWLAAATFFLIIAS